MYSHFVTTCLCEWPFFLFIRQMDLYHCYLFFCLKIYERTHCPHHWQTTWLSGIDAGTIHAKDAGSNGLTSIGERTVQSFISIVSEIILLQIGFWICVQVISNRNNELKITSNERDLESEENLEKKIARIWRLWYKSDWWFYFFEIYFKDSIWNRIYLIIVALQNWRSNIVSLKFVHK